MCIRDRPKAIGFERISELSGNEDYHMASSFFWDIVTGERSLAFGEMCIRDSYRTLFPIPQREIDANANLKPNPGY